MLSQILLWNALKMSNKYNKIWLKGLNPHILRDERLIGPKFQNKLISKLTES